MDPEAEAARRRHRTLLRQALQQMGLGCIRIDPDLRAQVRDLVDEIRQEREEREAGEAALEDDQPPAWEDQELPPEDGEFIDGVFHPDVVGDVPPDEDGPIERQNAWAPWLDGVEVIGDQLPGFLPPEDEVVHPQELGVPWCWRCGDPQNADTMAHHD